MDSTFPSGSAAAGAAPAPRPTGDPAPDARCIERSRRLAPMVADAMKLLAFTASNASPDIDDDLRNTIVAMYDAVGREAATLEDEQRFFKVYQELTRRLAPVTAETLDASLQRLPPLASLVQMRGNFMTRISGMTYGRFAHAVIFIMVIVLAALALGHQAIGSAALKRYQVLTEQIARLADEAQKEQGALFDKQVLVEKERAAPDSLAARSAVNGLRQANEAIRQKLQQREELIAERAGIPPTLGAWQRRPCRSWALRAWLCLDFEDEPATRPNAATLNGVGAGTPTATPAAVRLAQAEAVAGTSLRPGDSIAVDSARTTLDRLDRIVLPLLFGLLGSYSYLLRTMSIEIRGHRFAPHSALHHIARLSLGSLAGIAATWLLTPGQIGLATGVPMWTLAFVAGYGTELVFAFMDRIISAFKS